MPFVKIEKMLLTSVSAVSSRYSKAAL